jgi:hypothetical protein
VKAGGQKHIDEATKHSLICGGQTSSSSVKSNNKLLPNGLKYIKVIKDWEPVADFEALKAYSKLVPISGFRVNAYYRWNCIDRITNVNPYPDVDTHRAWMHCQAYIHGKTAKCNINNINSVLHKKTDTDTCGNIRMKVSVGEIMLGFRLEKQALLDKGHDDIYVVQAFINKDGININHASRGGNTVNYSWEYTYYSSLLAEIYTAVGYDYFEHTLPHGAKVHEYLSFNYRLLKDFKLTAQWAKRSVGSKHRPYSQIKNLSQAEYQKTDNALDVYHWFGF